MGGTEGGALESLGNNGILGIREEEEILKHEPCHEAADGGIEGSGGDVDDIDPVAHQNNPSHREERPQREPPV